MKITSFEHGLLAGKVATTDGSPAEISLFEALCEAGVKPKPACKVVNLIAVGELDAPLTAVLVQRHPVLLEQIKTLTGELTTALQSVG